MAPWLPLGVVLSSFLPLGSATLPETGAVLMALGLLVMFLGVAIGLDQRDIKVMLAYSSVSQMGFMTLGVGQPGGRCLSHRSGWQFWLGLPGTCACRHRPSRSET